MQLVSHDMLQSTDVPPGSTFRRLNDIPGNDGKLSLVECLPEIERVVNTKPDNIFLLGATGCGKSKILPEEYEKYLRQLNDFRGKLLVLTTAAKDVENMFEYCSTPSHFRIGDNIQGGVSWSNARIIFATVGLAFKWYANNGARFLDCFGAILFDEFGTIERNADYSLLYEVVEKEQVLRKESYYPFFIFLSAATLSERLFETVNLLGAVRLECPKRPHLLELYEVDVCSSPQVYEAISMCAVELLRRNCTSLVFLPGWYEIEEMSKLLCNSGVAKTDVFPLHSDLGYEAISKAKTSRHKARIVLSTSLAEAAMTISDVKAVLDAGLTRHISDNDGIHENIDTIAASTSTTQRRGRAGRTQPGCYALFKAQNSHRSNVQVPLSVDGLMKLLALENSHACITARSCRFLYATEDDLVIAQFSLKALGIEASDLKIALEKLPLSLSLSGIFLKARSLDVGFEAAALVALKAEGRWSYKDTFTVEEVVDVVSSRKNTKKEIIKLDKVRKLFRKLILVLDLRPSKLSLEKFEDRLAVSFLVAPERLIWSVNQVGSYLGDAVVHTAKSDYFVAVLLSRPAYRNIKCALWLPFSPWTRKESLIQPPTRTMKMNGDSTFQQFRLCICLHVRESFGFDMRFWHCRGGAWENQIAETLAASPKTDFTIVCPNGNRLSLQSEKVEPRSSTSTCYYCFYFLIFVFLVY